MRQPKFQPPGEGGDRTGSNIIHAAWGELHIDHPPGADHHHRREERAKLRLELRRGWRRKLARQITAKAITNKAAATTLGE